jgi:hypothetical protein
MTIFLKGLQSGRSGDGVILIDTGERMQDMEPLMSVLSKLIVANNQTWSCLLEKHWLEMMHLFNWISSNRALTDLSNDRWNCAKFDTDDVVSLS